MNIRHPVRAGTFYEQTPSSCRHHAQKLLDLADMPADLPGRLWGGLVPHAGWMYSGRLAAKTIKALSQTGPMETVVLFGADHCGTVTKGEVFDSGVWRTPLGEVAVDDELAGEILAASPSLRSNPEAHSNEHSIEVLVPLLQVLNPSIRIVPIAAPPTTLALEIGQAVGAVLAKSHPDVRVIGSTDLTHHGGGHFPAPGGHGEKGEQWSRRNDRRMLDLVEKLDAAKVVPEAQHHMNACGSGAVAATISAVKAMGATRGMLLQYTTSYEVVHELYPTEPDDTTVGYASVVFA